MDHQIRKRINFEDSNLRQTNEEKRPCIGNTQHDRVRMEACGNVCIPRAVPSSSGAPNRHFEDLEKKCVYDIKEKFRIYSRRCWDYYWKMVLQLILNGRRPKVSFNDMYKELYKSICHMETEAPNVTYGDDPSQTLSLKSWLLLNPTQPEHPEEEVVICQFFLQSSNLRYIMEQKNDAGVNAERILAKRLRLLKEVGNCHIDGVMELICSWSFCKRCIKQVAEEIKKVHVGVTKIIIKTRSALTPSFYSYFGLEVQPFTTNSWKEMHGYLTEEGRSYFEDEVPSGPLISEFFNVKATNSLSSVAHSRIMPLRSWFLFNEQLRTCNVRNITCLVCCVTFATATTSYCLHQTNEMKDVHAEAVTLVRLEAMQSEAKNRNDSIRSIRIYCTYSPCTRCISKYCSFLDGMPELEELHLIVSSVYMSSDLELTSELEKFEKKFRHKVKLEGFKDEYWEALKEHLSEEGARDLENKSKNFEEIRPRFSTWGQSPANTPRKIKH